MKNSLLGLLLVMMVAFVGCTTLEEGVKSLLLDRPEQVVTSAGPMNREEYRKWLKTVPWAVLDKGITDQNPIIRACSASEIYMRYGLDSLRTLSLMVADPDEQVADTLLACAKEFRRQYRVRDLLILLAENSPIEEDRVKAREFLEEMK